jgi:hypothetical protein
MQVVVVEVVVVQLLVEHQAAVRVAVSIGHA